LRFIVASFVVSILAPVCGCAIRRGADPVTDNYAAE
jgi:hypothetical protein